MNQKENTKLWPQHQLMQDFLNCVLATVEDIDHDW